MRKTPPPAHKPLNPKQKQFCDEYLLDANGTRAAIRAGYSLADAPVHASRMLKYPNIIEYIKVLTDSRSQRIGIDSDRILLELYRLATADVTQAYDHAGNLKPLSEIPDDVRRSISSLDVTELFANSGDDKKSIGLVKKIKFYDKTKALELLGKHKVLFTDKVEHSGKLSLEDLVCASLPGNKIEDG